MNFYQRPFLYLAPILILGLLMGVLFPFNWFWLLVLMAVGGVALVAHFTTKKTIFFPAILLTFLSLGGSVWTSHMEGKTEPISSSFVLEVSEQPVTSNKWKKGIGRVVFSKNDKEFTQVNQKILFYSTIDFSKGDVLYVSSDVNPIVNKNNPGEFDAHSYWTNKGIHYMTFIGDDSYQLLENRPSDWFTTQLNAIRSKVTRGNIEELGEKYGGVLNAMLFGDKSSLEQEISQSFSNAGAMHVLAVSGLHVGIILMILVFLFGRLRFLSRSQVYLISITCIWLYALITGFSPSVVRASLMFSIFFGAQLTSRKSDSLNALFVSAFVILVLYPSSLFDIGFQLSYLAVLGILIVNPFVSKLLYIENKWLRKVWEGSAVGISAQVFTIPLSLYYFHQFPNYFVLTNIAVMAFAGIILTIGLFFIGVQSISFIAGLIKVILSAILASLLFVIQFVESMPGAVAYGFDLSPNVVLFMYTLIAIVLLYFYQRKVVWLSSLLFVLVILVVQLGRYRHMNESHLFFLNHSKPLLILKNGPSSYCFHMPNDGKKQHIIDNYLKVFPSSISYHEITDGTELFDDKSNLSVFKSEEGIVVKDKHQAILVQTGYSIPNGSYDLVYTMGYLKNSHTKNSLGLGAIKLDW